MIVRINGQVLELNQPAFGDGEEFYVIKPGMNPKLKHMAITLWTMSASMAVAAKTYAASPLWDGTKPLVYFFQDAAMFLGVLAIIAGLILLAVKKRWGVMTLKTTTFIILGVFLAPSIILLIAIIAGYFDSALTEALKQMREAKEMMGGK